MRIEFGEHPRRTMRIAIPREGTMTAPFRWKEFPSWKDLRHRTFPSARHLHIQRLAACDSSQHLEKKILRIFSDTVHANVGGV
jgi:hypothetical protein